MAMAINPTVGTYSTRTLYVTPKEFMNAPTGVDTNNLVPGNVDASKQALVMQLQRASAAADNFCQKVIAATVDTENGSYRAQRHPALGQVIKVPLKFTPIIAVSGVRVGSTPSTMSALADIADLAYGPKTVTIPLNGTTGPQTSFNANPSQVFATVEYVNGWANTALTADLAPGATSFTVASALGIMPGQQLNIQSTAASETVTVDSSFTPSNTAIDTAVPVTTPIVGTYTPGDTVTAFPQDIKEAVILIAKSFIKTRGSTSVTISTVSSQGDHINSLEPGVSSDMDMAMELLAPYRRAI